MRLEITSGRGNGRDQFGRGKANAPTQHRLSVSMGALPGLSHHERDRPAHARPAPRRGRDQPHSRAVLPFMSAERTVRRDSSGCRERASLTKCARSIGAECSANELFSATHTPSGPNSPDFNTRVCSRIHTHILAHRHIAAEKPRLLRALRNTRTPPVALCRPGLAL